MKTCPICDSDYPDQNATCPTDGAVLIVSHELAAGALVRGKYRIVSKLGQGGMGVVYLAEHMLLGGNVALKFLAGELGKNPKFIKRFRMEARASHQLRHPNIVEVTDLDQSEDGSLFIAMEYVAGKSLRAALDEERNGLGVQRALDTARGIVSGLAAAHAQGTVHRDVKPENVLLAHTADGRELPKVLDFGIAAMAESVTESNMTRGLLLTPDYAAPEQWMEMPAAEIDGRTDLYETGCVFYEMLTGITPFHSNNMETCRRQHMEETPRPPSELRPDLADWTGLDGLVMRLLAKNRDDRPQDAEALSLLDAVQIDSGQQRQRTVVVEAWVRPQTIIEDGQGWQPVVPVSIAKPGVQPVSQPAFQPASTPVIQAQKPASQKVSGLVWGALAVVVVMAVAAGFAAVHYFAPKPQPQQTQATANQPIYTPPPGVSSNSYQTTAPPSVSQKPSPASKTNVPPATEVPSSSQNQKPTQADNSKPSFVLPKIDLPKQIVLPQIVKPPAQQPNIADITQQGVALYSQNRFPEAAPLFDKACSGGGWEACKDLGIMYRNGKGVQEDDKKAAGLFAKACDAGNALGCTNLGALYANNKGVAKDDSRAATLYAKACNAGDALGCGNLGTMYWDGRGVSQDYTRAAALYSRACDAKNAAACSNLGNSYLLGRGVAKNPDEARRLFMKSCGMNNTVACDQLKKLK
jgi:serine/threonine-protein kinase